MPFKIVETTENGKRLLSSVPEQWEYHGTLYWPRKNEFILKTSEYSVPETNWRTLPCILKRSNIPNYDTAEQEIVLMSDMSDTDQEVNAESVSRQSKKTNALLPINFNSLVAECVSENISSGEKAQDLAETQVISELQNVLVRETSDQVIEIPGTSAEKVETIVEKLDYLISMATANETNIQILFNNQQSMSHKLALLDTKLEEFITRSFNSVPIIGPNQQGISKDFKIISNLEELKSFEEQLNDPYVVENVIKTLSITCTKGKGRACTNAYNLIDVMFKRQFMTQCSWAGGTKGEPKICFKAFTKTISLFFDILHASDQSFTKPECEQFLKNIMRHSLQRNSAKLMRASAQKRRPKKTVVQEVTGAPQEEIENHPPKENIPHQQHRVLSPLDLQN